METVRRVAWLLVLVGAMGAPLRAQTLAHKGWAGNGFTVDVWWKNAVFYELDPRNFQDSDGDGFGDLKGVAQRLDYLQGLGVDAVVLSPFQLQAAGAGKPLFDARYGTEEDFDRLEQEASRRKIRLVVDVPLSAAVSVEETVSVARFWLSLGVGGVRNTGGHGGGELTRADWSDRVGALRRLCAGFVGDRVVITEMLPLAATSSAQDAVVRGDRARKRVGSGGMAPQLTVDPGLTLSKVWNASTMKAVLLGDAAGPGGVLESDSADLARSWDRFSGGLSSADGLAVAKMVATVLFAGREEPMLYFGQEIGMAGTAPSRSPMQWGGEPGFTSGTPWTAVGQNSATANVTLEDGDADSLLNWYRKLSQLRHEQASLHEGMLAMLDTGYPEVVAWVRRGDAAKGQPVLVVCNTSGQARVITVAESLRRLGLSAVNGVHPLAVSIAGMKPSYVAGGIELPPYGVYVGELRQPGLEDGDVAMPVRRHR